MSIDKSEVQKKQFPKTKHSFNQASIWHLVVWPLLWASGNLPGMALAGLLVGTGTALGSGCTSGHGVCGLARLSRRSLVAVCVFLAAAVLTTTLIRHVI